MNNAEFQLRGVGDPRLALHATSPLPAWLWSADGTRILWANPVGAKLFGAANAAVLAGKTFGPADLHRRQVAQLAGRLPPSGAIRLERLRGFGAPLGTLATCGVARLEFADGHTGILITSTAASGRAMPLIERLQRLVEGVDTPIAAFTRDGMLAGASDAARGLSGFRDLSEAGLEQARSDALTQGRVEMPIGIGHMVLQRVGSGADIALVALIEPAVAASAPEPAATEHATPDYEQPAISGEAPAEFALIDEFAEPAEQPMHPATPPDTEVQEHEPSQEFLPHEPSPSIEAVADEPASAPAPSPPMEATHVSSIALSSARGPSWIDEATVEPRQQPLRFMWQMDAEGRFSLGSDEFTRLIGVRTAASLGRLWSEIAEAFGLDPDGRVLKAVATRDTWSGITLNWPVDGGSRLPVELSGLPLYELDAKFCRLSGFRGLPRSRRPGPGRRTAPLRIVQRCARAGAAFRRRRSGGSRG